MDQTMKLVVKGIVTSVRVEATSTLRYHVSLSPVRCGLIVSTCALASFVLGVTHAHRWIVHPLEMILSTMHILPPVPPLLTSIRTSNSCHVEDGEDDVTQSGLWTVNKHESGNANSAPIHIHPSIHVLPDVVEANVDERHSFTNRLEQFSSDFEALVHPALITHENPRHVLLVTSQHDWVLMACEVLKQRTIDHVHVVELADTERSSRSPNLILLTPLNACQMDHRVTVEHFNTQASWDEQLERDTYDVVLVQNIPLGVSLVPLVKACFRALNQHGIFVQETESILTRSSKFVDSIRRLEQVGYKSLLEYSGEKARSNSYIVALKLYSDRGRWYRNEAEINLDLATRSVLTSRGKLPFASFDGATMMQYQFMSRLVEEQWCRDETRHVCGSGHGYDPDLSNANIASFTVRPSTVANGGRGVFSTKFIPQGSALAMDEYVHVLFLPSTTMNLMDATLRFLDDTISNFWATFYLGYVEGYGFANSDYGPMASAVEPCILSFMNHGCNGTYNTGEPMTETELTVKMGQLPVTSLRRSAFDPRTARSFPTTPGDLNFALRDIEAGSELLDNYLVFGGVDVVESWDENLRELQSMCTGGAGSVSMYESTS